MSRNEAHSVPLLPLYCIPGRRQQFNLSYKQRDIDSILFPQFHFYCGCGNREVCEVEEVEVVLREARGCQSGV